MVLADVCRERPVDEDTNAKQCSADEEVTIVVLRVVYLSHRAKTSPDDWERAME